MFPLQSKSVNFVQGKDHILCIRNTQTHAQLFTDRAGRTHCNQRTLTGSVLQQTASLLSCALTL